MLAKFFGVDGQYHPEGSFLGTDGKYHPKGSFLGVHGRYEESDHLSQMERQNQNGVDC